MNKKILNNRHKKLSTKIEVRKNKRKIEKVDIEDKYEEVIKKKNKNENLKRIRYLLPVKTINGAIKKRIIEEEITEHEESNHEKDVDNSDNEDDIEGTSSDNELIAGLNLQEDEEKIEGISKEEFIARKNRIIDQRKIKIGLLASNLLEDPENRMRNLKTLIDMIEENISKIFSVKKILIISLFEIFKDLLPSYRIHENHKQEGVKYKKETRNLQNFELMLIKYYRTYLQKLEKLAGRLRKKQGDTRILSESEILLGEVAMTCMSNLLIMHPYFNYSANITDFLIPFLNNKRPTVREIVAKCFSQIFKEDKKAELTLTIVKKINQLIKTKGHSMHKEALSVLLDLKIKNINLDKEREEDHKMKKLENHKQRVIALSKRERKKNKKLEQIEQELLETKAEEDKTKSHKILTEITTIVFTIYFRMLKQSPNSKLLSVCLEGLAKFAHSINLDFYQDLVNAINNLMENENLGQREQLHCIQTIFMILSGQGSALNIDPHRFYSHLYRIMLDINLMSSSENCEILIKCLVLSLVNRRKRVPQNRIIAFIKRIMILSTQLEHHGALGLLGVVKSLFQLCKNVDILLDTDSNVGEGFYQPELNEPEHCNAHCTALWELIALQRHYHIIVRKVSKNIAAGVPTTGEGNLPPDLAKLSPEEFFFQYNPSQLVFNPSVPVPKKIKLTTSFKKNFASSEFKEYIQEVTNKLIAVENLDFYKAYKKK